MRKHAIPLYSISVVTLSLISLPVIAADTQSTLEEVVVTATKVGEVSAQDVPSAITVFGEKQLHDADLNNIEDLKPLTPGLNISRNGKATRLYLRGIGTNLDFIGSDPSVTVQVDGVYQSRGYTALDDFLDVERVEVLRGPQGTLYGRNSTGGTINIITKLPDAKPKTDVSAELGNYSSHRVQASTSGGLGSDRVIGSLAVMQTEHDPYIKNVSATGIDGLMDDNTKRAVGSLRSLFGENGELILRADYTGTDSTTGAYKTTGLGLTGAPAPLARLSNTPSDPFEINISLANPFIDQTSRGHAAELNWQLSSNWKLTSITAYRNLDFNTAEDTDGSNQNILVTDLTENQNQLSEELRMQYKSDQLSWVTGMFALREDHDSDATINVNVTHIKNNYVASNETDANALFSQGTYHLSSKINATLGLRYSKEKKHFENTYRQTNASNAQLSGFAFNDSADWSDLSPKLTLDYTIANGAMLYTSASKGFKSGGFNMTSADAKFDQEKVWAYEVGSKLDWLDDTIRTNMALFYYNYTDLQVSDFTQPGVLSISNAAAATNKGFEVENEWLPTDNWAFELNYSFLNASYDKYMAPRGATVIDVSGNQLNLSPRHHASTAVRYSLPSSQGEWNFRLEYSWQSKEYFTAFNEDVSSQGAYGLLNAQAMLTSRDRRWDIQLFGNNLGNKDYSTSSREFPATSAGVTRDINPPRTIGTRMTYHFM